MFKYCSVLFCCQEKSDIYPTKEPREAFHQRIQFCLDLYTQSVKVSEQLLILEVKLQRNWQAGNKSI